MNRFAAANPDNWEEAQDAFVRGVERQASELRKERRPIVAWTCVCGGLNSQRVDSCRLCGRGKP